MNERIFEIIQELNGRVGLYWDDEDKEEFAELIVKECANVAWHYAIDWCPEGESPDYGYARVIKEHFGVEE